MTSVGFGGRLAVYGLRDNHYLAYYLGIRSFFRYIRLYSSCGNYKISNALKILCSPLGILFDLFFY